MTPYVLIRSRESQELFEERVFKPGMSPDAEERASTAGYACGVAVDPDKDRPELLHVRLRLFFESGASDPYKETDKEVSLVDLGFERAEWEAFKAYVDASWTK